MSGLDPQDKNGLTGTFERLKAELGVAFAAPDTAYAALTADELISRNRTAAPHERLPCQHVAGERLDESMFTRVKLG